MKKIVQDAWESCYPSKWKGLIVPDAIKHPAKYSSKLIARIYEHMKDEGWIKPGDVILDPFGGVALGAFDAMRLGLRWRGVELEVRFSELGNENIALWNKCFSRMPHWSQDAVLYNGDSRQLLEIVQNAGEVVSSPPYAESMGSADRSGIDWSKQQDRSTEHPHGWNGESYSAAGAVSSPPYADSMERKGGFDPERSKYKGGPNSNISNADTGYSDVAGAVSSPPYSEGLGHGGRPSQLDVEKGLVSQKQASYTKAAAGVSSHPYAEARIGQESGQEQCGRGDQYGATQGQLGAMKNDGFDAAIASPPYGGMGVEKNSKSINRERQYEVYRASGGGQSFEAFCATQEAHSQDYGNSDGQLSHMQDGDFDSAVSSPPYEAALTYQKAGHGGEGNELMRQGFTPKQISEMRRSGDERVLQTRRDAGYSRSQENLGNDAGDSFWLSARQIVDQVYLALRPGGHAVWVVKAFVKDKQVVDFPGQWQQLCEAAGFRTMHIHHAMLTNHRGASYTLEGGSVEHKTEAKSFFRRNGENKARAAKWWATSGLSRACQADWLYAAHDLKWKQYHQDLEKNPSRAIKMPKPFIIRGKAQSMAYEAAGSPDIQIDTSIDYEVVICMQKAEE